MKYCFLLFLFTLALTHLNFGIAQTAYEGGGGDGYARAQLPLMTVSMEAPLDWDFSIQVMAESKQLLVRSATARTGVLHLRILSLEGKTVWQQTLPAGTQLVKVGDLSAGFYLLEATNATGVYQKRLFWY